MSAILLKVPERWADMSQQQLEYFCRKSLKNLSPLEIKTHCFLRFARLKYLKKNHIEDLYEFKHGKIKFNLDADRFAFMLTKLDFLDEPPGLFDPPERIKGCYACDSRLYNLRLDEWFVADNNYSAYIASRDTMYLDQMIAVFYTQAGQQWNNGDDLADHAMRFAKIPQHIKQLVFLWYTGVKLWLINKYYYVFNGGNSTADSPADEIVMGMLRALNGGNVANNERVKASLMHEALFELNQSIEESKKIKK